ncbi:hypothetical protein V8E36_008959 [Tilletia maclaganii]
MVVRLRLARHGTRNNPFYHIVAIHNKKRRNALPIEKLGEYDPIPRWKPVPTSAAGPSTAARLSTPAPVGSAAAATKQAPRSQAQVSDLLAEERAAAGTSGTQQAGMSKPELAQQPRPGHGLLMTSGLQTELRLEKRIEWNESRIRYWLKVGAQPSKPVARLLDKAGLIPPGKWFKGMRPLEQLPDSSAPPSSPSASPASTTAPPRPAKAP